MKFIKSASCPEEYIMDDTPEICFVGRSNVGKSSIINALANQKNLAKTSSTPGRTKLVNFFDNGKFRLVDLPGYGFAKVSKREQFKISEVIDLYITQSRNLKAVFQVCDANVITDLDVEMANYFNNNIDHHYILLNKVDKNNISKYQNNLIKISSFLKVDIEQLVLTSAKTKLNIKNINNLMYEII